MNYSNEGEITSALVALETTTAGVKPGMDANVLQLERWYVILKGYLNPGIGCFGLLVNTIGLYILYKSGLKKPSNIFLASLLVADSMYLTGAVNCGRMFNVVGPGKLKPYKYVWEVERNLAYVLYVVDQITFFVSALGGCVSPCLPVFITTERLLAVFFPLKFKTLVTRNVALFLVISLFLFWTPWIAFIASGLAFDFVYLSDDSFYGVRVWSDIVWNNIDIIVLCDNYIFNCMTSILPASFVIFFCFVIGIKIKLAHRKRKLLSNTKTAATSRTTITLLTVSLISVVFQGTYFVISVFINDEVSKQNALVRVYREIQYFTNYCASSSNTIIYVILNYKLRNILINSFKLKFK